MPKFVLKDASVRFNEFDISGILNSINMDHSVEAVEANTFNIDSKRRLPGLESSSISHNGYWDSAEDAELHSMLGAGPLIYSVAPLGDIEGGVAFTLQAHESSYSPGAAIGEVFGFTLNLESTGNLVRGVLGGVGAKVANGNGPGANLGAVSSSQKVYASLHVIAKGGTTPTLNVVIESDNSNSFPSPITQLAFVQVGDALNSQFIEAVGPITDTWWRARWTLTGVGATYTVFIVFGIR